MTACNVCRCRGVPQLHKGRSKEKGFPRKEKEREDSFYPKHLPTVLCSILPQKPGLETLAQEQSLLLGSKRCHPRRHQGISCPSGPLKQSYSAAPVPEQLEPAPAHGNSHPSRSQRAQHEVSSRKGPAADWHQPQHFIYSAVSCFQHKLTVLSAESPN